MVPHSNCSSLLARKTTDGNIIGEVFRQGLTLPPKEVLLQLLAFLSQLLTIFAQLVTILAQPLATSLERLLIPAKLVLGASQVVLIAPHLLLLLLQLGLLPPELMFGLGAVRSEVRADRHDLGPSTMVGKTPLRSRREQTFPVHNTEAGAQAGVCPSGSITGTPPCATAKSLAESRRRAMTRSSPEFFLEKRGHRGAQVAKVGEESS